MDIYILEQLQNYNARLHDIQGNIQHKLDNMDENNDDLFCKREEQIDALDEIIEAMDEVISLIEGYNSQWRGLKTIK